MKLIKTLFLVIDTTSSLRFFSFPKHRDFDDFEFSWKAVQWGEEPEWSDDITLRVLNSTVSILYRIFGPKGIE